MSNKIIKIGIPSKGRLRKLVDTKTAPELILEEVFLATYARMPRPDEQEQVLQTINQASDKAKEAWEDVLWAMFNSKEFLFQH